MTNVVLVRLAVQKLGDKATSDQIIEFVRDRFGEKIEARFLPIYRATVRGEEYTRKAREVAARGVGEERERNGK